MANKTGIEWTDATWNPVTGCTKVSPGCDHCYAEGIAHRFAGTKAYPNGFDVTLHPKRVDQPLRWRKPRRVFVNSMSDLFHKDIPDDYIARVFAVMALAPQHTFQILTKRPARMRSLLKTRGFSDTVASAAEEIRPEGNYSFGWPLPNVWLGVSVENQRWADIRIPELLDTPAAVRFISAEPLLGPLELYRTGYVGGQRGHGGTHRGTGELGCPRHLHHHHDIRCKPALDWVIVGGESGPGARPMHPRWAGAVQHQCAVAGVPFLFKQWGEWSPLAPLNAKGRFDFRKSYSLADDGTLYEPGALAYPDGPRYGEAVRADHGRSYLTSMYRVGKKNAGRELGGQTWDEYPGT